MKPRLQMATVVVRDIGRGVCRKFFDCDDGTYWAVVPGTYAPEGARVEVRITCPDDQFAYLNGGLS